MTLRCLRGIYLHAEEGFSSILSSPEMRVSTLGFPDHLGNLWQIETVRIEPDARYAFVYPVTMNGTNYVMFGIGESPKTLQSERRGRGIQAPYVQFYLVRASDFGGGLILPVNIAEENYISYEKAFHMRPNELESLEIEESPTGDLGGVEPDRIAESLLNSFLAKAKTKLQVDSFKEGSLIVERMLAKTLSIHRWAHEILVTPINGDFAERAVLVYEHMNTSQDMTLAGVNTAYPKSVDESALEVFKKGVVEQSKWATYEECVDHGDIEELTEKVDSFLMHYANRDSYREKLNEQKRDVRNQLDKLRSGPKTEEEVLAANKEVNEFKKLVHDAWLYGIAEEKTVFDNELNDAVNQSPPPVISNISRNPELTEQLRISASIVLAGRNEQARKWWGSDQTTIPRAVSEAYRGQEGELLAEGGLFIHDRIGQEQDYSSVLVSAVLFPVKGLAIVESITGENGNAKCKLLVDLHEKIAGSSEELKQELKGERVERWSSSKNPFGRHAEPWRGISRDDVGLLKVALQTLDELSSKCEKMVQRNFLELRKSYREILKLTMKLDDDMLKRSRRRHKQKGEELLTTLG